MREKCESFIRLKSKVRELCKSGIAPFKSFCWRWVRKMPNTKIREWVRVTKGIKRNTRSKVKINTNYFILPQKHPSTATSIFFLFLLAGAELRC